MTTAKKVVAKKTAPAAKKAVAKAGPKKNLKKAKRVLVCALGEQCFWTTDGTIISNLVELKEELERMTQDVFEYHVTESKNDFADWIQYVLGDPALADKLRTAHKPKAARSVVVAGLKVYDI